MSNKDAPTKRQRIERFKLNRNPSATKKGPGRYHEQGHKKTAKSLTTARARMRHTPGSL